ncbi:MULTISPECIES: SDR family NAD(P)-dependent oxidoreductase [Streptomyces]|uniref:SDR family NAD(P)-dependent oxidoreductase n=1 Tax=Streptomyces TaxID=1883 RepID=UPI0004CDC980|nr:MULTISPECIES: SDR family NAD(P)-dependent oxidoreductase [Streptomyces]KOT55253.1 short-chain dehydrogenase [Streptomyces rimosus subsp. rimosus]
MPYFASAPPIAGLSALVTGGSRGLGLLMARQLLARGARVTILARDGQELAEAARSLRRPGGPPVATAVCDVRDRAAVDGTVEEIAAREGGLDIVIGNAGVIQVGPAASLGHQAFHDAMASIFDGALNTSLAVLPHLRRSPAGGRLALIGSVGGLLAVPHLLPYSCAKFAVAALAEGLHAEESGYGVSVTAVHPGLMRTGSHLHAQFGGDAAREYAWFSALAGTPVLSMNAERAAGRIVSGVQRRRPRVVLTPAARLAATAHGLAPVATTRLSSALARVLPRDAVGAPGVTEGAAVESGGRTAPAPRLRKLLGALNDRAAGRFNQCGRAAPLGPHGRRNDG